MRQVQLVEVDMEDEKDDKKQSDNVFPSRLKIARELRGYNQVQLGEKAKMPASSVAHFESGNRKPSFDTLKNLANALDVTTDYLIGRADNPAQAQAGDALYRHVNNLTGKDRELAAEFLEILAKRNRKGDGEQ
jgi:transcriptional regulator with XRE-family HTH domain